MITVQNEPGMGNYDLTAALIAAAYVLSDLVMLLLGGWMLFASQAFKNKSRLHFKMTENVSLKLNVFINIFKIGLPVMLGMIGQRFIFYLLCEFFGKFRNYSSLSIFHHEFLHIFFANTDFRCCPSNDVKISQARGERNSEKLVSVFSYRSEIVCYGNVDYEPIFDYYFIQSSFKYLQPILKFYNF